MHSDVLRAVDKLELQLQRSGATEARTGKPDAVPAGYNDSVAEYYRRLSKGRQYVLPSSSRNELLLQSEPSHEVDDNAEETLRSR